ncbi:NAD-dependent epimerase/dehydratase family protein [Acidisoma sp. 7E03]
MTKTALITGATGGVGSAVAEALLRDGWQVRALTRRRMESGGPITWITGDAMRAEDVIRAAAGVQVIFHGANPPGYRNWRGLAIPMLTNAIAAAKASGARLIYPGSVYVYGPDAWPRTTEGAPQHPRTRKGKIRVEMEAMMQAEVPHGLRFLVLRAGDYFGPQAPSSWLAGVMAPGGKPARVIRTPERPGVRHAWAYLPDLAEAIAQLADREADLGQAETFHFAGHVLAGRGMAEAVARAAGGKRSVRTFPWPLVYAAAPFVTFLRELIEMRYLWREEILLDNRKLVALLGGEPQTPLDVAVGRCLIRTDAG